MSKAPRISLNLGKLKLGSTSSSTSESQDAVSGFGTFGKSSLGPQSQTVQSSSKEIGPEKAPIASAPLAKDIETHQDIPEEDQKVDEEPDVLVDSTVDVAQVMGFAAFGDSQRKAKQFDMGEMFEQARLRAANRNAANNAKLEEEGKACLEKEIIIEKLEDLVPKKAKPEMPRKMEAGPSKATKSSNNDEEFDSDSDDEIGPPIPGSLTSQQGSSKDQNEEDSDDEKEETLESKIPKSHECKLVHGDRAISALTIDPSGSRLASGSVNYELKLWDFSGMDASLKSFRSLMPCESHVIRTLQFSATGDKLLVVPGSAQPKVLDRDGHELFECVKGDPYVTDMRINKGHVGGLTSGCWHPKIKEEFLTSCSDCTLRIWMTESNGRKSKDLIKCKSKRSGLKTIPTACTFSQDGLLVAAACQDGSLQMWDHRKTFINVTMQIEDAHTKGTDTSCVAFGYDNRHVATRGGDETLKLWDVRSFRKPVHVATNLYSRFDMTDCCFSPNDQMIVTATSMDKGETAGKLVFFEKSSFNKVVELEVGDSHVIKSLWHPKLNQIIVGSGDGVVRVFYDPDKSVNGAKLCMVRTRTKAKQTSYIANMPILTPFSLPMYREDRPRSTKRMEEKARKDPVKSHRPDLPLGIKGTGGRVQTGGSTLHSWMAKQLSVKNKDDHIDPRERILRHAEEAETNPYWVAPAYKRTQPEPIFRESTEDEPPEKLTKNETFG